MNWISKILGGGIGEKAVEFFTKRQELKNHLKLVKIEGEIAIVKAKTDAKVSQQTHIQSWEMQSLNIHSRGWKDEVVLLVVLFPYIGCFIPGVQDYILTGFEYLAKMPYWAVGLTVTICLAIYGIRHKNASKLQVPGLRDKDVKPEE